MTDRLTWAAACERAAKFLDGIDKVSPLFAPLLDECARLRACARHLRDEAGREAGGLPCSRCGEPTGAKHVSGDRPRVFCEQCTKEYPRHLDDGRDFAPHEQDFVRRLRHVCSIFEGGKCVSCGADAGRWK